MNARQREAARLWEMEQREEKAREDSRHKARYLQKYLSDIGDTGCPEAEEKLNQIRVLVRQVKDLLDTDE